MHCLGNKWHSKPLCMSRALFFFHSLLSLCWGPGGWEPLDVEDQLLAVSMKSQTGQCSDVLRWPSWGVARLGSSPILLTLSAYFKQTLPAAIISRAVLIQPPPLLAFCDGFELRILCSLLLNDVSLNVSPVPQYWERRVCTFLFLHRWPWDGDRCPEADTTTKWQVKIK